MFYTGPSGVPNDIIIQVTSTSLSAVWKPIMCVKRNGPIIGYVVDFHPVDDRQMYTLITSENFVMNDLIPYTNYTFNVAGRNVNGTGPYSNERISRTNEDGK